MKTVGWDDIQRKIAKLEREKQKLDEQIKILRLAGNILFEENERITQESSAELKKLLAQQKEESENYAEMTTWQALSSILKENKGITSRKLIEIAREGGLDAREDTIRSTLSKRCKRRDIKVIKGKGERLYCFAENKPSSVIEHKQQATTGRKGYPWTERILHVLKTTKMPLTTNEITKEIVKMGKNDATSTNNQAVIYSVVKRQTKRGLVGVDNSGSVLKYFWKGPRG